MPYKENLRHLVVMAAADGRVTIGELRLLGDRAVQWGITDDEFEAILDEAIQGSVELEIPQNEAERRALLSELVRMMAADGKLHAYEKKLFAVVASNMNISETALNEVIDRTIAEGLP
jgi:DnaJ-domain-containing protein 1